MKKIKIKGLTSKAKNRINTHSKDGIFFLREDARQNNLILVESLTNDFRLGEILVPWAGWFFVNQDMEIVEEYD
jgi:hypothetical protein